MNWLAYLERSSADWTGNRPQLGPTQVPAQTPEVLFDEVEERHPEDYVQINNPFIVRTSSTSSKDVAGDKAEIKNLNIWPPGWAWSMTIIGKECSQIVTLTEQKGNKNGT